MKKYKLLDVFVPGGIPEHTYVTRQQRRLEEQIGAANDQLCKLVTVTGVTKSGKTVLTNRVYPRSQNIWVDAGAVRTEDDLWSFVLHGLGGSTEVSSESRKESEIGIEGHLGGEGSVPFVAKAGAGIGASHSATRGTSQVSKLTLSPRSAAVLTLRNRHIPIIIDDFHYLDRELQGSVVRALKQLVLEGLPVILIAIPHRRYDAVKVEQEITGRLEEVSVPAWEPEELLEIAEKGFRLLNVRPHAGVCERLAEESFGSPHLMQEFCRELARRHGISETSPQSRDIENVSHDLFVEVAKSTGKVIYDKLARGPRARKDRIQRGLKNGKTADIYQVVLLAMAHLKPGLTTIDYEALRQSIRDILADNIPTVQEVARVLEKMAEIAATDEASAHVLDWEREERRLHIADPFFAFYLRWGVEAEV